MKSLIVTILLLVTAMSGAGATEVSIVNVYPGKVFYELEGHTVLRITDPEHGDIAVSYGTFDFNAPNFLYRFVKGETDYYVSEVPWNYFVMSYMGEGRRIVEHKIDMTEAQSRRLVELLKENFKPENRVYRYNYVKDNCATRPLMIVQKAMGDSIVAGPAPFETRGAGKPTFRNVMRYYHANYPWYQLGIDLALGSGIDYEIDRRELAFAPAEMDAQLDGATVGGRPLVKETVVLADLPADNAVEPPTPWLLTPMSVFTILLALIILATVIDQRRGGVTRWIDSVFYAILGITGLLLTFLIFVSVHEATSPNWLYLWINPGCLIPAVLIWLKKCKRVVYSYQIVNFVLIFVFAAGWYWIPQSTNAAFIPLILADAIRSGNYMTINRKR